ncbi:MAG: type II toxin-antitoxin system VapC family toxin [Actinobacteria bacterium]|nr:type II toxin-antitoxin system VapC family toxin [Actinomycetota bacterium]
MIGYFDTSALVKLLLRDEDDAETVRSLIAAMDVTCTSRITLPEARAALAAARRAGRLAPRDHATAKRDLHRALSSLRVVELHPALARAAGDVAERFSLRALDAVHLASALALGGRETVVVTWDRGLARAATAAGLGLAP